MRYAALQSAVLFLFHVHVLRLSCNIAFAFFFPFRRAERGLLAGERKGLVTRGFTIWKGFRESKQIISFFLKSSKV